MIVEGKLQSVSYNLRLVIFVVDISTGIVFPWKCPGVALISNFVADCDQSHRKMRQSMLV